ncbi:MAG: NADH-quinone oxidoreductase subunit M [Alphaproteobacteria bacterium]|nr:NADH-quinone oxidoreductase subunit M [Alphaproteobacteria bacterium]
MVSWPILSVVTFLPTLGALLILLFVNGSDERKTALSRYLALAVSLVTFAVSLLLLKYFDPSDTGFQLVEKVPWIPKWGMAYHKGVDGVSFWFVLMSTFLTPICVLSAFSGITKRTKEFMIALLLLETMMIGMFTALDFILFYLFFEAVLIPMFLIVGVWGGPGRVYAAYKFFLYTFVGSVLMLVALIAMCFHAGTTDMTVMIANPVFPRDMAMWLWLAFFASFAVKAPMWPLHTWLPFAHVEAPTAGSVMLAGVLLKMGGYGLIRISIQMLPEASAYFTDLVFALSIIAIIYTSLVALVQQDLKKLIAYSSVAHMGYVTLGIFTMNTQGLEGAMFVMLSHTVVSSALFLCVGVIYDRLHTREIARYGGLANNMPHYAFAFMVFMLASVGLPGTSGFVGEFLSMQGAYLVNTWVALLAAVGVILGAAYMLWLYRRVFYGPSDKPDAAAMPDLNWREYAMFLPMIGLILWMGIYPASFKDIMAPTLDKVITTYHAQFGPGGLQ